MKIDSINRGNAKLVADEAKKALEALSALGLTVEIKGGVSYDPLANTVEIKFKFSAGDPEENLRKEFEANAWRFNVKPEAFGIEFQSHGRTYRLTGINPNRPKYPFSATDVESGQHLKFQAGVVKHFPTEVMKANSL